MKKQHLYYIGGVVVGSLFLVLLTKYLSKKFDLSLFDSPDLFGSGKNMDKTFLKMLKKAEKHAGFKFKYSSWFRTKSHNKIVGGVENSAHTKGMAVDIKASSIKQRDAIVAAARKAGFKRIGIATTFVHLDNDLSKPLYVAWGYPKGTKAPYDPFRKAA